MLERSTVDGVHIRTASADDAAAIAEIYNQGIEDRIATYGNQATICGRSAGTASSHCWSLSHRCAQIEGEIIGWAGAGPYRDRECYRGIGEFSMYVHRDGRRRGVGDLLLAGPISEAERLGLWKLLSRIFPFNKARRALCR